MSKIVRYELDLNNPPPLTEAQKAEIKALSERAGNKIDYSDIPPLDESFWAEAVRNPFYKPKKTSTSLRLDADVLAWFKSQGKGYQTRINNALRDVMLQSYEKQAMQQRKGK
ncbi:BrnA antitoxin family protein [Stenoxybacter acetivorans]|uniref:BrnA antitoxin family protein n=1 Tax=Stenoxybacter acetivorans TaxID=422441 RepID=UPI00055EA378|nr:BrnA antitoxin family protein [Stenoxybacter acetivorans]